MRRLIGRYADEFNTVGGTPDEVRARFERAHAGCESERRDPHTLVTSLMTWFFVAPTHDEYVAKLRRAHALDAEAGSFEAYRDEIEADCIVGTPDQAVERLQAYADAGVQRIYLNLDLYDDLEMLDLVATEVLPQVGP
jgi:alkanesulfonate monooxygenase SsuD/methylene tetrahydromethanopterin reductase-like flavin-dependent oxidoreductase (luciferase family)